MNVYFIFNYFTLFHDIYKTLSTYKILDNNNHFHYYGAFSLNYSMCSLAFDVITAPVLADNTTNEGMD